MKDLFRDALIEERRWHEDAALQYERDCDHSRAQEHRGRVEALTRVLGEAERAPMFPRCPCREADPIDGGDFICRADVLRRQTPGNGLVTPDWCPKR